MTDKQLFVALDMGATKVQASAVTADGRIFRRLKNTTPRDKGPGPIVEVIEHKEIM